MTSLSTLRGTSVAPIISSMSDTISASSIADVAVIANLVPNTESKWSRWSSWSDCTKTCGTGTRQRNRTCVAINQRAVFAPISCAGKAQQIKSCAEWSCPDCNKNCTIGTLNSACDACTCDHHVLTGRILTEDDSPLSEVNISLTETPYNILAQTNVSGFFTAFGVCAGQQELLVTKTGFVPVRKNATVLTLSTATITLKLEIAVPPFITVHPESKMRMPGQSVTFCCDGKGNPPPEIEWFKDNNVIDKDLFSYDKTLEIFDARGLNGSYRCRAVNLFGAEFSNAAGLELLELNQDSCSPTPSSRNVTLPPGCVLNGTNTSTVDVGECEPVACVKNDSAFNSSCQDPSFCCGPSDFIQVLVDCGDIMSFNLSLVSHCSCGQCKEKVTIVQGIVVGGPREEPVGYGDVIYDGKIVSTTDVKGTFSFAIPGKVKRAIVTFKDYYKKFEETNKVFVVTEGSNDFHKIKLKQMPPPVAFNASEPLDIPLGSDPNSDSFADLELPEESFLTEDGSVFQGNAKATISVTDSRNLSDVLTAPGDFTTTDEDGEEGMLETFGMVKLKFEDDSGKKLALSKPMKVYLDPEKLNINLQNASSVPLKLYWLDKKTERWREAGDFQLEDGSKRRRKRSDRVFFVGTITPTIRRDTSLNFDAPAQRIAVKVIATKLVVNNQQTQKRNGVRGVVVTVIKKNAGGGFGGYTQKSTNADGVACIPIWRNEDCLLKAENNGKYLRLINRNFPSVMSVSVTNPMVAPTIASPTVTPTVGYAGIDFTSIKNSNQATETPLYEHDNGGSAPEGCIKKPDGSKITNSLSQFSFDVPDQETDVLKPIFNKYKPNLWNTGECFIKVKIVGTVGVMFAAESYKEDDFGENGKISLYLQVSKNLPGTKDSVVCLQFNCPTSFSYPYVRILPLSKKCQIDPCKFEKTDLFKVQYPKTASDLSRPTARPTEPPQSASKSGCGKKVVDTNVEKWLWIPTQISGFKLYNTFRGKNYVEKDCLRGTTNKDRSTGDRLTDLGVALEYLNCK